MMKALMMAAVLAVAGTGASAHIYAMAPEICSAGAGAADTIEVRNGYFRLGPDQHSRIGKKRGIGEGFFEGDYGPEVNGEIGQTETFRLRIRDNTLDLIRADGTEIRAVRCPNDH